MDSKFTGGFLGFVGMYLLAILISVVSFGIAMPWAVVMFKRWQVKHSVIEGQRLMFVGSGLGLFVRFLLWGFIGGVLFVGLMIAGMFMVLDGFTNLDLDTLGSSVESAAIMFVVWVGIFIVTWTLFRIAIKFSLVRWYTRNLRVDRAAPPVY